MPIPIKSLDILGQLGPFDLSVAPVDDGSRMKCEQFGRQNGRPISFLKSMLFSIKGWSFCSRLNPCLIHFHSFPTKFKSPTHESLHFLLEKCSSMRELRLLHAQLLLHGLSNENLTLGKLISFLALSPSGHLPYACSVFDRAIQPNKFMYNSLIRGYSNSDDPGTAISLYFKMVSSLLSPNEFTLPFVLKACAFKLAYWEGVIVHGHAIKLGIGYLIVVQNALIHLYSVCGFISFARQVFDDITNRTLVSWNSMIGGYSRIGHCMDAFLLFREMIEVGLDPDEFTLVNLLSACSKNCNLDLGKCLHLYMEISGIPIDQIVKNALLVMYAKGGELSSAEKIYDRMNEKDIVSRTSMIDVYSKHGQFRYAHEIFDQMPQKNVVSWNSMISCYIDEGQYREALRLFHKMCESSVAPDETTLLSVLSACSQIGDLVLGEKIHAYILSNHINISSALSSSLIDMYAKCGALRTSIDLFLEKPDKSLVSWNVIIRALALHGHGWEAIKLFNMMVASKVWPDEITFTGLLSACSHSGLVDMGLYFFERMSSLYGILREIEHYACVIDLLGRGGFVEEAIRLIAGMPMRPDAVIWGALLSACRTHGHVEIGKQILKQVLELEPLSSGIFVLLSNIYCEAKKWDDMKKVRKVMTDRRIIKCRGKSFIEIDGCVFEFMVDDKRHDFLSLCIVIDQLTDHLKTSSDFLNIEEA